MRRGLSIAGRAAWQAAILTCGRKNEAAFRHCGGSLDAAAACGRLPPHMARRGALRTAAPRDGQGEMRRVTLPPRMRSHGARRVLASGLAAHPSFFFAKGGRRARAAWYGGWITWGAQRGSPDGPTRHGSAPPICPAAHSIAELSPSKMSVRAVPCLEDWAHDLHRAVYRRSSVASICRLVIAGTQEYHYVLVDGIYKSV